MLPIDYIVEEAERQGLRVERVRRIRTPTTVRVRNKWLLIEGHHCQAIPARKFNPSPEYPRTEGIDLYLPLTDWPDFLIYVVRPKEPSEKPSFYIVPRGALSSDTAWAPTSGGPLARYKDAWDLLRTAPSDEDIKRRFKILSPAIRAVVQEAVRRDLHVALVARRRKTRVPPLRQHRVHINGRRCQVMSAPRLSVNRKKSAWNSVLLKAPNDDWGEFVIYVVKGRAGSQPIFIIPRSEIERTTTRSLLSSWMLDYTNAWWRLSSTAPTVASRGITMSG